MLICEYDNKYRKFRCYNQKRNLPTWSGFGETKEEAISEYFDMFNIQFPNSITSMRPIIIQ